MNLIHTFNEERRLKGIAFISYYLMPTVVFCAPFPFGVLNGIIALFPYIFMILTPVSVTSVEYFQSLLISPYIVNAYHTYCSLS